MQPCFSHRKKSFANFLLSTELIEIIRRAIGDLADCARMEGTLTDSQSYRPSQAASRADSDPLQIVRDALRKLRFGGIQLTVHEGKLVQIDVTERRRLP